MWKFFKNLEIEIPFDSAIPLLGIYSKDYKLFYHKDTCTQMFTAALFTIAKIWNQLRCPSMIDWTKKRIEDTGFLVRYISQYFSQLELCAKFGSDTYTLHFKKLFKTIL